MRLAVSGVSLAASRSRSAPTPLAKNTRDEEEEERVGTASMLLCHRKIIIKALKND